MSDFTSEDVGRIASQLRSMLPNLGSATPPVPGFGTVSAPSLDGFPPTSYPPQAPSPEVAAAPPILPSSPSSVEGIPRAGESLRSAAPTFLPATPAAPSLPGAPARFPSPTESNGLRDFVRRIRSTGAPGDSGSSSEILRFRRLDSVPSPTSAVHASRPLDVAAIRREFPILEQKVHGQPLAWLDNAATTQKPNAVIEAIRDFYRNDNSNIHRGAHTLAARATDAYELARERVRSFINAGSTKEILFVRGATEGINLVAKTYGAKFLRPGDDIVLSVLEHHANIVPWQMIANEKGATLRVIPVNDRGEIIMEAYEALLGPKTRIVALTHASNSLGTILPIEEMTRAARRHGARVLIDGAQTVAHVPVDVQRLDCDFFAFSGHKIFAPTGIGVVYARQELLDVMPPWQGGGNMIRNVTFEETTYADPPAKFEAGTPSIGDAVGLRAALDFVNLYGLPNIAAHERRLLDEATEKLSRIDGLRIIGTAREKVAVLSFVIPGHSTEDIGRALDREGIAVRSGHHCAQPSLRRFGLESTVRPSFSIYNTSEEIDRLACALKRLARR